MKKSILLLAALFCFTLAFSQELIAKHSDKGSYLEHTVVAKENYYSIGRLYNISPKEIESFNGLDMNKGLTVGQLIRIPLVATNYSQSAEGGKPVYYIVGEKEGLYRVSLKNNNVLMANLRKWNKLPNDNLTTGKKLIVGFLAGQGATVAQAAPAEKKSEEAPRTEAPKPEAQKLETPKKEISTELAKKDEPVPVRETEKKPEPVKATPPPKQATTATVVDGNSGFFRPFYEQQVKARPEKVDETVATGVFKTASGWQDAKYYALMDNVEPGTIIRVINPNNSKVVYAKVLGEMSGIRQNQGYNLRLSNAAASALEVSDTEKFIVRVAY